MNRSKELARAATAGSKGLVLEKAVFHIAIPKQAILCGICVHVSRVLRIAANERFLVFVCDWDTLAKYVLEPSVQRVEDPMNEI